MDIDPIQDGAALLPKRKDLAHRMAGREALIRHPDTQMVHFLSPTAVVIWECCDGRTSLAACQERLRAQFTVPEGANLAQDIQDALADFARKDLLEKPDRR